MTRRECLLDLCAAGPRAGGRARLSWLRAAPLLLVALLLAWSPWGLWEPDEGRYADVAQEMLDRGDFVTPRLDGALLLDKPPLVYWVTAGGLALLGPHEAGARAGQFLFAAGLLVVTFETGWMLYGDRRAALAVLVLASSAGFFAAAHILTLDLGLAFFVSLTDLLALRWWRRGAAAGRRSALGACAAAAGGVLTKGPVAVLLSGLTVGLFLLIQGAWRRLRGWPWVGGTLLFLALAAPWFVVVSVRHPDFAAHFFLHENLVRFATTVHHRAGAWWYYGAVLALGLLPWTPALLARAGRGRAAAARWLLDPRAEAPAFLLAAILPTVLFFSVSHSKLPLYVLPVFPALAVAVGAVLDRALDEDGASPAVLWAPLLTLGLFTGVEAALARRHHGAWQGAIDRLPVLALLALLALLAAAGHAVAFRRARRGRSLEAVGAIAVGWALTWFLVLLAGGRTAALNDTLPLVRTLEAHGWSGERVYNVRCALKGMPFYLRRTVGLVETSDDDFDYGKAHAHDPFTFPTRARFLADLRGPDRVFAVVRSSDLEEVRAQAGVPLAILARTPRYALVSNREAAAPAAPRASAGP